MSEWVISSTVLIGAVCLGRRILKGKIGLRFQYALWAIVLIRLLIPFNFTESAISVLNFAEKSQVKQNTEHVYIPMPAQDYEKAYTQVVETYQKQGIRTTQIDKNELQKEVTEKMYPKISLQEVLFAVWIAGMVLMGICLLAANLRFSIRLRRTRRKIEVANCPVPVYITKVVETPCLFGTFRPSIYLTPEVVENQTTCEHVLAHEMTHYHHFDHVWSVLRSACLLLHWYNPFVWIAAKQSRQDGELACDEGTLKRIGEERRADYGRTLVALTSQAHFGSVLVSATTMVGGKKAMKERITLLMKKPKSKAVTIALVLVAGTLLAGCTFTKSQSVENEKQSTQMSVTKEDTTSESEKTKNETDAAKEGKELTEEELKEMMNLFETDSEGIPWYSLALTSYYQTPEEMNLYEFFHFATENEEGIPVTEDMYAYLEELEGVAGGIELAVPDEMNEVLMTYFGIPLSEANLESIQRVYYEPTDTYLMSSTESNIFHVVFTRGCQLENGDVELYYTNGIKDRKSVVTLYQHDGVWRIKSNMPVNYDGIAVEVREEFFDNGRVQYNGLDQMDKVVWTYMADYNPSLPICNQLQGDIFYFMDGEKVASLNRLDGSILWENDEYGGYSEGYVLGEDGTFYLCSGEKGPDFFAVDKNGNTLVKIDEFDSMYPLAAYMEYSDNYIDVRMVTDYDEWNMCESEEEEDEVSAVFRVSLEDYSYERVK